MELWETDKAWWMALDLVSGGMLGHEVVSGLAEWMKELLVRRGSATKQGKATAGAAAAAVSELLRAKLEALENQGTGKKAAVRLEIKRMQKEVAKTHKSEDLMYAQKPGVYVCLG